MNSVSIIVFNTGLKAEKWCAWRAKWFGFFSVFVFAVLLVFAGAAIAAPINLTPFSTLSSSPSTYPGYPASNATDSNTGTRWLSYYTYSTALDYGFNSSYIPFTLDSVALTGDGGTSMLKQFQIYVLQNGSSTWYPLNSSNGAVSNYNYAMSAQGGQITNSPSTYPGYPYSYLIDGTANTRWLSYYVYNNDIDLAFDPNLNGVTAETADQFTLKSVALTGDGGTSMLQQFQLYVQKNGSSTWNQLYNSIGSVSGYNYAMSAQGGQITNSPSTYPGYPYSYLIDGTANTRWLSYYVFNNNIDLAFDPNLNGVTKEAADQFNLKSVALTGDGGTSMLQQFQLFVQQNGSSTWAPLYNNIGAVNGYNFALSAQGGQIANSPSTYPGYPYSYLIDGTVNTRWLSNYVFNNNIDLTFDPNLNGVTKENSDQFSLSGVALTGDGGTSMLQQFQLSVQQNGSSSWSPIFASSGPVTGYNFAMSANGGQLQNMPSTYPGYPSSNLIDGTANTRWLSNYVFSNNIDLAFDPNLNNTTKETADQFTLTGVALTGDGGTSMLQQFQLFVQQNGSSTWSPLFASNGSVTGYNFALAANGGQVTNLPSTYPGYPSSNLVDGTANTRWLSNYTFNNNIDLVFDPNQNGTPGENADRFTLSGVALTGDGGTSMLQQFQILVQQHGSSTWSPLFASSGAVTGYNFAMSAQGGQVTNSPSVYSGYPISNLIDGTTNTRWLSNYVINNTIDFAFDADLNGTVGKNADEFVLNSVAITGDGSTAMVKQFQIFVQQNGGSTWTQLGSTYTASQSSSRQVFSVGPASNVTAVRLVTLSNYGYSYLSINEFEVIGDGNANSPLFTLPQDASRHVFSFSGMSPSTLNNITGIRLNTVNNYGYSYLSLNEFEVLGDGSASSTVFTMAQNGSRQLFNLSVAVNPGMLSNVTGVRLNTINNYGYSYLSLNELEVIGDGSANSTLFTMAQNSNRQVFSLSSSVNPTALSNVSGLRLNTINNYGYSYLSLNELEVFGDGFANSPIFSMVQNTSRQVFTLSPTVNASALNNVTGVRLNTINNYGYSYLSLNELEVLGDGNAHSPLFSLAQNANRQEFIMSSAVNPTTLSNISAVRLNTVNNFGYSYLSINELEVLGDGNAKNTLFTLAQNSARQTFTFSATANTAGALNNIVGVRLNTVNNYGYSYLSLNEFEMWGTVGATSAVGAFNTVEVGTNPATGVIKTKVAGQSFNLDIVAMAPASTSVLTSFVGNVTVEMVDASGSGTCGTWPVIGASGVLAFTSTDNGRKTVTFQDGNAWRNVRVRVKYPVTSPTVTSCSTDNFSIRPASLTMVVSDTDSATPGSVRTLDNIVVPGGVVHKAGQPFSIFVTGRNALATPTTTTKYDGTPTFSVTGYTLPASCAACIFTAGSFSGSGGTVVSNTATYSDVGVFTVQAKDDTFAAVDAADGSTTAELTVYSSNTTIGRFVPDHFDIAVNTPSLAAACGSFSYLGQSLNYVTGSAPVITVKAMNAMSPPTATTNYTGSLWQITNASLGSKSYSALTGVLDISGLPAIDPVIGDSGGGGGTLTFSSGSGLVFKRASTPTTPFSAEIALSINILDADGVAYSSNPARIGTASAGNGIAVSGSKEMRFGRLRLSNKYGSEKSVLQVPVQAQYWSAVGDWQKNTADSCTTVPASAIGLSNPLNNKGATIGMFTNATGAIAITAGQGSANLAASTPITGSVDICLDLAADPVGGVVCSATSANLPYMQGKWYPGTAFDNDPLAKATFGVYTPETRKAVHVREIY